MPTQSHTKKNTNARVPTVVSLVQRTRDQIGRYDALLDPGESMLSHNKVTGYSLNFPIAATCAPSKVCAKTCYFARGGASWPDSLKKQYRLFNTVRSDPIAAASRLETELGRRRNKLSYLRWNGGGDLFPESVICLNEFARVRPDLPLWVVTRLPKLAALVEEAPNVFIHFSIDLCSTDRREVFEKLKKKSRNYFYSYQCDRDEEPDAVQLEGVSVVFYDGYDPPKKYPAISDEVICPLNKASDICGVCERCRRCFDGSAVQHSQKSSLNHRDARKRSLKK
jgi:hypothetical protein